MPAATWEIIESRGRAGLGQLEADWRRIYAELPLRTSFLAYETCCALVDHVLAAPDQLRCLALTDGQRVRAICLLEPRLDRRLGGPVKVWGVLWPRHGHQAEVLCADDEARRATLPALLAHLRRRPEGRRLLTFGPAPAESALWEGTRCLEPGDTCEDPKASVRILDCRGPFAGLVAGLPRKIRSGLNSARQRLETLEGLRFVTARELPQLDTEFTAFLELEASGWKGAAGSRSALKFRGGLPMVFRTMAAQLRGADEHFEILALYAGDHCLASMLGTRTGATFSALKITYDEAYGRMSPGNVLLAKVIERCCDDPGIRVLDLVSDAPWVRGWPTTAVPLRFAYVNLGRWRGRALIALLKLRFGPARRCSRWLQARRAALGSRWSALVMKLKAKAGNPA